jgi:hypothetical protein
MGLWLAEIIRPRSAPPEAQTCATVGVGHHAEQLDVQAGCREAGCGGRLEQRSARAGVAADHDAPPLPDRGAAELAGSAARERHRQLGVSTSPLARPRTPSVPNSRAMLLLLTCREAAHPAG